MRKNYERLTDINDKHNEVHRKAYFTPYLHRTVSSYPAVGEMDLYEEVLYINSTVSAIRCVKISDTKIVSASLA